MAILKVESVPVAAPTQAVTDAPQTHQQNLVRAPIELFQHFGVSQFGADTIAVNDISEWAFQDGSLGDGLLKLKKLQRSLGTSVPGERLLDKVHRWVSLQKNIGEMRKRQEALYG